MGTELGKIVPIDKKDNFSLFSFFFSTLFFVFSVFLPFSLPLLYSYCNFYVSGKVIRVFSIHHFFNRDLRDHRKTSLLVYIEEANPDPTSAPRKI